LKKRMIVLSFVVHGSPEWGTTRFSFVTVPQIEVDVNSSNIKLLYMVFGDGSL
jgi:hypothetical protein